MFQYFNYSTFLALILCSSLFPLSGVQNEQDAIEIIKAYNGRDFGSPGKRSVELDLKFNGKVSRSFQVTNLWDQKETEVKTLFFLKQPENLQGTCYLLKEQINSEVDMGVHLYLPSGKRQVLSIAPDKFEQGLLGSDFGYNDLRMQLPLLGYRYQLIGKAEIHGFSVWIIRATQLSNNKKKSSTWAYTDLFITVGFPFLMRVEYYKYPVPETSNTDPALEKIMQVECLDIIDDVWTASKMVMYTAEGQSSELRLRNVRFKLENINPEIFKPESLPKMKTLLE